MHMKMQNMNDDTINWHMDYAKKFRTVQDEGYELFKVKNSDYGNAFVEFGAIGILIRMNDKLKRAVNLCSKNVVTLNKSESLRDTLIDLHNYAAMLIMVLDTD